MNALARWTVLACLALCHCAAGGTDDDTNTPEDAAVDSISEDVPHDVHASDIYDAHVPPPNDATTEAAPPEDVVDTFVPPDEGMFCPGTCTSDSECESECPPPSTGYHYCCQTGSGGGSCAQQVSACPSGGADAGHGSLGSPCTDDSQCTNAPANCCLDPGSGGVCSCTIAGFCGPPMLCE